jgi:hypothetical protein
MKLRTSGQALVLAAALAASVMGAAAAHAQPSKPKSPAPQTCEQQGYAWDDVKGCADQYCLDGLMGYGDPGETQVFQNRVYMCDGFTGQWTALRTVHGGTGLHPLPPGVIAPVIEPSQPNPGVTQPVGSTDSPSLS